jgi:hypothetical protein
MRAVAALLMAVLVAASGAAALSEVPDTSVVATTVANEDDSVTLSGTARPVDTSMDTRTNARAGNERPGDDSAQVPAHAAGLRESLRLPAVGQTRCAIGLGEAIDGHDFLRGWYLRAPVPPGQIIITTGSFSTAVGLRHGGMLGIGAALRSPVEVWDVNAGRYGLDAGIEQSIEQVFPPTGGVVDTTRPSTIWYDSLRWERDQPGQSSAVPVSSPFVGEIVYWWPARGATRVAATVGSRDPDRAGGEAHAWSGGVFHADRSLWPAGHCVESPLPGGGGARADVEAGPRPRWDRLPIGQASAAAWSPAPRQSHRVLGLRFAARVPRFLRRVAVVSLGGPSVARTVVTTKPTTHRRGGSITEGEYTS